MRSPFRTIRINQGRRWARALGALAVTPIAVVSLALMPASAAAATYAVTGVGTGTLHVRSAPGLSAPIIGNLPNGTQINITCQTRGDQIVGSTMWDRIDAPVSGYVADWYTTTPVVNNPSPGLPACGAQPAPTPQPSRPADVTVALAFNGQSEVPASIARAFYVGPHWSGFCEAFVAYATTGLRGRGYGSALQDYYAHLRAGLIHYGVPPAGAVVYWNPANNNLGHIGISLGNGQEISTYGFYGQDLPIQIHPYTWFRNYLGWAMP